MDVVDTVKQLLWNFSSLSLGNSKVRGWMNGKLGMHTTWHFDNNKLPALTAILTIVTGETGKASAPIDEAETTILACSWTPPWAAIKNKEACG